MAYKLKGLSTPIKSVDGTIVVEDGNRPLTAGKVISRALSTANSKDPVGAMIVAQEIYKAKESVDLEDAEFEMVKKSLNAANSLRNFAKAPCQKIIDEAEKLKKK